jgi:putative aldouronate transport system permease protein
MQMTKGERTFSIFNYILLGSFGLLTLYPFIYVLSCSISNPQAVAQGDVVLYPIGFQLKSYAKVFSLKHIWVAYGNSLFYTIVGTVINLLITAFGAYPLSKKYLPGRKIINILVAITLWFSAGIIPFYLNIRNLGLLDTRAGILFAFACYAFYVFLMRTYFESLPDSIEESAKMDGANDITILFKLVLPMAIPAMMTIGLYYAIDRWNGYFWASIILQDESKIPLQVWLKKMVVESNIDEELRAADATILHSQESLIYTTIVISALPAIILFPFIQKYFIKGITLGAVKA